MLADNTIKSVDLNNDKTVVNFRVIVNPNGFLTRNAINKDLLIKVSYSNDKIFMRSLPGKLQAINLHSGHNEEI